MYVTFAFSLSIVASILVQSVNVLHLGYLCVVYDILRVHFCCIQILWLSAPSYKQGQYFNQGNSTRLNKTRFIYLRVTLLYLGDVSPYTAC